jgi:hypothetical protein
MCVRLSNKTNAPNRFISTVTPTLLLVCEHLLDNGAFPNYTDDDGNHALLLAVSASLTTHTLISPS